MPDLWRFPNVSGRILVLAEGHGGVRWRNRGLMWLCPVFSMLRRYPSRHAYGFGWSYDRVGTPLSVCSALLVGILMISGIIPYQARSVTVVPLLV